MSCEFVHEDGAYVLGALSPTERAAYERHLADCAPCREAVGEIAVLPGLLRRLDAAGVAQIAPPAHATSRLPGLVRAVAAARRRERRAARWRATGAALAAACLALVASLGLAWWGGAGDPDPAVQMVAMRPIGDPAPVRAEIGLTGTDWGTEVTMRCAYRATGGYASTYTFRLVAHGPHGATEQVGSWVAAPGDEVTFTGATRFTGAELDRLELTRNDGTRLLAYHVP